MKALSLWRDIFVELKKIKKIIRIFEGRFKLLKRSRMDLEEEKKVVNEMCRRGDIRELGKN